MSGISKLIILRGNSGCGKTTTGKLLQKKFGHGTMMIPQDVVRREILYVKDSPEAEADQLLLDLVFYGMSNCNIVILEGILHSKWYKKLFDEILETFQGQIHAYYFDVSFEETLRRHQLKQNSHEFGEKEMRSWWNDNDFLDGIEEKVLTEEQNQNHIVEKIYQDVLREY